MHVECLIYVYLFIYLLTYLLTPWNRVLLEKITGFKLVKKLPTFYGNRRFITAFTSARHLSLSWARSIQTMPPFHFLKIHLNIILPYTPGSSKWSLSSAFPIKILYMPLLSHKHATCSAQLILLDLITWTILSEQYRLLSFSLYCFLHSLFPRPP